MSEEVAIDPVATVTVNQDGRTLSGVGVDAARLTETMDRRAPAEETDEAPAVPAGPAQPEPQPKLTRGQARFSELVQQREAEKAEKEAIKREFDEFKAKFRDPTAPAAPAPPQAGPATTAGPVPGETGQPPPSRPEPTEDEVGTKYETYGAFVRDQAQWVWEQQQHKLGDLVRQQLEQQKSQQELLAQVESTRAKGRSVYPDFDMLLQHGAGTHVNMPEGAIRIIYSLPNSEHVQYAIMKDAALAQRLAWIATNQPHAFGLELSKIAPAAPAVSTASTGNTGSATPPPPMQPVGSGSTTTSLSSAEHAKAGNYAAYKAARLAERGGRRR